MIYFILPLLTYVYSKIYLSELLLHKKKHKVVQIEALSAKLVFFSPCQMYNF